MLILVLGPLAALSIAGQTHTSPRNAVVDARGANRIEIKGAAGLLALAGIGNESSVRVDGMASAPSRGMLDDIQLIAERRGTTIYIEAVIPQLRRWGILSFGNLARALDLRITLPRNLELAVTDGSGDIEIRGTAGGTIEDGSGNVRIEDVMGRLDITDGSGDIRLTNVTGPVKLTDGSGSIWVEDIGRDLVVEDGSGDIFVRRAGNVHVVTDGSGSMTISDAAGWVRVDDDGSGDITVNGVGGDFTVASGGSGSVNHSDVRGRIQVPSRRR